jgi:sortase A
MGRPIWAAPRLRPACLGYPRRDETLTLAARSTTMSLLRIAIFLLGGMALFGRARARRERQARDGGSGPDGDGSIDRSPKELVETWVSPDSPAPPKREGRRAPRKRRRRLAVFLILTGIVLVGYAAATVLWRDPVTDLYARWQQHRLDDALAASIVAFQESEANLAAQRGSAVAAVGDVERRRQLVATAKRFDRRLKIGQPLGRIIVPRLKLNKVFVHGTRWREDLSRGPGHYPQTEIPAIGQTVAIAGHRTTFGAPFRRIDKLRGGDEITLQLPYGTFHYVVFKHRIVDNSDWSIIKPLGFDAVVLSACHPLYSAAQRWVVFARLSSVETIDGGRLAFWQPKSASTA